MTDLESAMAFAASDECKDATNPPPLGCLYGYPKECCAEEDSNAHSQLGDAKSACRTLAKEVERLQSLVGKLRCGLTLAVHVADEAYEHWDNDCNTQVGEQLLALRGKLPGYMPDADAIHAYLEEANQEVAKEPDHAH